jgi:predicted esterase
MSNTIAAGQVTFPVQTPYKLFEAGEEAKPKPLLIYLHGFNQRLVTLEKHLAPLFKAEAFHLLIEAPYPIFTRREPVPKWGKAWYAYDGNQQRFKQSLERISEFIQASIDRFTNQLDINRIGVIGYSMGGYVAGYFGLSRYRHISELVMYGGRLKSEWFVDQEIDYSHLGILAVHGKHDDSVKPDPQKQSLRQMKGLGAETNFQLIQADHELNRKYATVTKAWLSKRGYLFTKNG